MHFQWNKIISCCQFYQEKSDLFKKYSDSMTNNQISIFNCSMNNKEYTCNISSQNWNKACLQSWMWYLYLLSKSFTWEYHQKNYEIKSSSSKKNDWWMIFIEYKAKKENNKELDDYEKKEELQSSYFWKKQIDSKLLFWSFW